MSIFMSALNTGNYRDKTMADTLMYIPNDDTHNYTLSKFKLVLKTQLNEPTNQNSLQSPKLLSQRIRQRFFFYKTRTWGLVY